MSGKDKGTELLEGAWELSTPQDSVDYYRDFSAVYDTEFISTLGYCLPKSLAAELLGALNDGEALIADIGCGTGVVAEALGVEASRIDGFDISAEMLDVARAKGVYQQLHEIDLTAPLGDCPRPYGAVVSAGTFTHGHLGPAHLIALHSWVPAGALFCIGINARHFSAKGFDAALGDEAKAGRIRELRFAEHPMYDQSDHPHANDTAKVALYRI